MSRIRLVEASDEYVRHCQARGNEVGTVDAYRAALKALVDEVGNIEVRSLQARHLDVLFAARKWQASTRNSRLAQLKGFFAWCRARGYMHRDTDPAFGWSNVRVPKVDRQRIPAREWGSLFDACRHPQETMSLAAGLYLFIRASEMKRIQLKDIHLGAGEILIHRVKTKEDDLLPISSELAGHLRTYLTWMSERGFNDPEHYLLGSRTQLERTKSNKFILGTGEIDHTHAFSSPHSTIKRILRRAGYPDFKEGAHTLRRSGARAYFDALCDQGHDYALRRVQSMLGHSTSGMTERYLGIDLDKKRRNAELKLQPMFPTHDTTNVVPLRREM